MDKSLDPISAALPWRDAKTNPPKKNGRYLVTKMVFDTPRVDFAYFSTNLKDLIEFKYCGNQYSRPGWYNGDSEGDWEETDIIGWMPEPEPMKEQEV